MDIGNGYTLEKRVTKKGVFRGKDPVGNPVFIKKMDLTPFAVYIDCNQISHDDAEERAVNRILYEANILQTLREHPLSPDHTHLFDRGTHYLIVPDYGENLLDKPENVRQALIYASEFLSYAHANGVVHRDIKPTHLLTEGRVIDFGDAYHEFWWQTYKPMLSHGTPGYIAPECQSFNNHSPEVDVYGFCLSVDTIFWANKIYNPLEE